MIRGFEWATTKHGRQGGHPYGEHWHEEYARVHNHAFSLDWRFPDGGTIDFLSAGEQNQTYAATLSGMDWENFYNDLGGGQFLDALAADMRRNYDYALIDSRTGLSDVADICTIQLPDILVDCFTLSDQGIEGAAQVARAVQKHIPRRDIRILPVPMRIDPAEKAKAETGRRLAMRRFEGLPAGMTDAERAAYWAKVQVPYQAFYGYEETLATFGDLPGATLTLLSAYETLTRYLTDGEIERMPHVDETVRERINARFVRRDAVVENHVTLRYASVDLLWAEWVEHVLISAGVRVHDPGAHDDPAGPAPAGAGRADARELLIVSRANAADVATMSWPGGDDRTPLAVYVADLLPLPGLPLSSSAFIAGLTGDAAAERLLVLVGRPGGGGVQGGMRYPADDAAVFNVPARNARFTGRDQDLRDLRARLRAGGQATGPQGALPVALQGMGGVGKSQVAVEYAYRYGSAYDVVWWITADPVTFIDSALVDLGVRLGITMQPTAMESARAVLQALGRGEPYSRWLLIFDNAEDIDAVLAFVPRGRGHVLVTSRNPSWGDRAEPVNVEVFRRRESVAHLMSRVPAMTLDEANRVSDMLGDLPIAVAAAGAWLADTGAPVAEYLRQIERRGPSTPSIEATWEATWDVSLSRLRERSAGAYRMLQLCSVVAPEIALDLVYSDELAEALVPLDPAASERMVRAALVQQINRLALVKLDMHRGDRRRPEESELGGQVRVHRLLQAVVRSRMSEEELGEVRHQVHMMLAAARPPGEVDDPETLRRFRMLWPHLAPSEAVSCPNESVRRLLIDRVRYLGQVGDLERGRELAQEIDEKWTGLMATLTDARDRLTLCRQLLHLRFNLANILRDLGRFEEALQLDEAVLAEQLELLGPNHPHTLMTAGSLAADLRSLGRYEEALKHDEATYASWVEIFGEDNPRTLIALSNLAVAYRLMGDFRRARERDEDAHRRRRRVLSENHPLTLMSAAAVGRDLREAGEYERSVAMLEGVAATLAATSGAESRDVLNARANLAVSLRSAGRANEATGHLEVAYERLAESLGPLNPDTLACRLSRAVNMLAIGTPDRAARELSEVRAAYERLLGRSHPHVLVCVNNLAAVARAQRDRSRARKLARSAATDLRKVLGQDHPYTLAAHMNLAVCLAEENALEEALVEMRAAADRMERALGPHHPDALRGKANVALVLRELDPRDEAADHTRVMEALASQIGVDHPAVRAIRERRFLHRVIDPHPF
jgi:tetratricopeptide (TPR) repeat protein